MKDFFQKNPELPNILILNLNLCFESFLLLFLPRSARNDCRRAEDWLALVDSCFSLERKGTSRKWQFKVRAMLALEITPFYRMDGWMDGWLEITPCYRRIWISHQMTWVGLMQKQRLKFQRAHAHTFLYIEIDSRLKSPMNGSWKGPGWGLDWPQWFPPEKRLSSKVYGRKPVAQTPP